MAGDEESFAGGRYTKRKRTKVNYDLSELEATDAESDFETAFSKKRKKDTNMGNRKRSVDDDDHDGPYSDNEDNQGRTPSKVKKSMIVVLKVPDRLPKRDIFPFLDLPAEIRIMVYNFALIDPEGINLAPTLSDNRRVVERVSPPVQKMLSTPNHRYYGRPQKLNDHLRISKPRPIKMATNLLSANKQIQSEAYNELYKNEFTFTNSLALFTFLNSVGPSGAKNLRKVHLLGYELYETRPWNDACFAVLVWASNLTDLKIGHSPSYYGARRFAKRLYRDAYPWLMAVGVAQGRPDAAIDLLDFDESSGSKDCKDSLGAWLRQRHACLTRGIRAKT